MKLTNLIGSGDKIGLFTLPFLIIGLILNPSLEASFQLKIISLIILVLGVINWAWSVFLILTKAPKKELITTGPFAIVKHPLYTGVALLALPWIGFLVNSWLGLIIGTGIYIGSKLFAKDEEKELARIFGKEWTDYCQKVKIPWL